MKEVQELHDAHAGRTQLSGDVETEIRVEVNFFVSKLDDDVVAALDEGLGQYRL